MPNLGDHIGNLLTEITNARVQADLESVRLADLYATHPLLKAFPVPRFRLPTVTIDIPVAVSETEPDSKAGSSKSGLSVAHAREAFQKTLEGQLKRSKVNLEAGVRAKLSETLHDQFDQLGHSEQVSTSAVHLADSVTNAVEKSLAAAKMKPEERNPFIAELRDAARMTLVKLLPTPPRIRVVTNSAQLREMGSQEFLTRVQLNITEQGVEWKGEDGGKRLVPE